MTEAAPERIGEIAAGMLESQQLLHDLTDNWDAAGDADPIPFPGDGDYPERLEAQGYAELVAVDEGALNDAFAWERGIEPGGSMWQLTEAGKALRAHLQKGPA